MKTYGLTTTVEDYKTLKEHFGKIQIRIEFGNDVLFVYNDFLERRVAYPGNPKDIATRIRSGENVPKAHPCWPDEWK